MTEKTPKSSFVLKVTFIKKTLMAGQNFIYFVQFQENIQKPQLNSEKALIFKVFGRFLETEQSK